MRARAERLAAAVGGEVEETRRARRRRRAAAHGARRRSPAQSTNGSQRRCATHEPPVIGIVRDGRLLLDCRTLADGEIDEVAAAVRACR